MTITEVSSSPAWIGTDDSAAAESAARTHYEQSPRAAFKRSAYEADMSPARHPIRSEVADLTAIAALATSSFGRDLLTSLDVSFAQGMIPHHEQAVEMAQMATAQADRIRRAGVARSRARPSSSVAVQLSS